ncbi:STAS/SEC14 domain-containing protein [Polyangium jinanense]|uniref:STAS/SEC14 domain-containing protein n=1 Tax=Polyangium jinanense TaxID=2829994 RepID=UPI002340906E|nr:STAS/SEC14 domain-containing protein [Polyangium jinanense]MDC3960609.1 STAS/SEC14 domain-containing protein [Polyangium jinanense]
MREKHTVFFEPPDTAVWRFAGDISEAEMRELTSLEKSFIAGRPYLLKLVDLSRIGSVSAGARKAGAEKVHDVPVLGVAVFGAHFAIRVLADLVVRAGSFIRRIDTVPTRYFATEAEARAWLAERRAVIATEKQS